MSDNSSLITKNDVKSKKYEKPKLCYVLYCYNSSVRTPKKHFVYVRRGPARLAWLEAGRVHTERSMRANMYCCEDHFDVSIGVWGEFGGQSSGV